MFVFTFCLGNPTVTCPVIATSTQSQITFTSPGLADFPNNGANTFLTYTVNNFDVNPPIQGVTLASNIPASQQNHALSNLQLGNNQIIVLASDTTTNPATTATCTFTFFRTGEFTNDNKHLEPVISTDQRKEKKKAKYPHFCDR